MKSLLDPESIGRYADCIVKGCLSLGDGHDLILTCQPAHRELAVAIVEAAYRAGARSVETVLMDPYLRAARVRSAPDAVLGYVTPWQAARFRSQVKPETATCLISGESLPGALDGLPVERLVADATRPLERLKDVLREARKGKRRWTIAAWPSEGWASQVYPKLDPLRAQRKLARDLLSFSRLGPDDPPGIKGWTQHLTRLDRRAQKMTKLALQRIELRGPGTELDMRLAPGTVILGGSEVNAYGFRTGPNIPTEEVFTSPEAAATEGTFRCSRPLAFQGRVIEGITGEFCGGRLKRIDASKPKDRDFLAGYLGSIKNADRLGEVAFVDSSSRIGQSKKVFFNTLLDENAASHIAFGSSFPKTRAADPSARGDRGLNRSQTHLDVMIGTDDMEITGIDAKGKRIPLIADGVWQI